MKRGFNKYALFAADFETTYHKQFSDDEIRNFYKDTNNQLNLDFEPNESSQVFLAGLMSLKDYTYQLSFERMEDFFNNIVEQTFIEKHLKAIIYFHNLAYDGSYIRNWLIYHGYKHIIDFDPKTFLPAIYPSAKTFACLCSNQKMFHIMFYWRGIKLIFMDSLKLFQASLESLGEIIGYPKLKDTVKYEEFAIKKSHDYPQEWLTYLKRDCEILAHYLNHFFEMETKAQTIKKTTIGSIAYSYVQEIVNQYNNSFTVKDYLLFQNWYHGGICYPCYPSKWFYHPHRIKLIDACSMYPSQMIKPLPFFNKDLDYVGSCHFYEIKIKEAIIKDKYKTIPILWKPFIYDKQFSKLKRIVNEKYKNKHSPYFTINQYLDYVENETYYIVDVEWELIKKIYDVKYQIIKTYEFKTAPYLKDAITSLFQRKKNATNKVERNIAKLIINSISGKLGQKPFHSQDFYGKVDEINLDDYEVLGKKVNKIFEAYNIQKKVKEEHDARPIIVISYVTALSRVCLIEKAMEIINNGGTVLYFDTDSVSFIDNVKPMQLKNIYKDLGGWEYEVSDGSGYCSLCPKQYRIVDKKGKIIKFACAGVKRKMMEKVANIDYNYSLGENKKYRIYKTQLKKSIHGNVIWNSPFNFIKYKDYYDNPVLPKQLKNEKEIN